MTCDTVKLPDGATAIVCSRGRRKERCQEPGCTGRADYLCDFDLGGKEGTCDKKLCKAHRNRVGRKDFCPFHLDHLI